MKKVDELDLAVKMIYNQLKREKVDPRVSLIFEEFIYNINKHYCAYFRYKIGTEYIIDKNTRMLAVLDNDKFKIEIIKEDEVIYLDGVYKNTCLVELETVNYSSLSAEKICS